MKNIVSATLATVIIALSGAAFAADVVTTPAAGVTAPAKPAKVKKAKAAKPADKKL